MSNFIRDRLARQADILRAELSRPDWDAAVVNEILLALQAILDESFAASARRAISNPRDREGIIQ